MTNALKMIKTGLVVLFLLLTFSNQIQAQTLISATDQTALRPPLSGTSMETIFAHEKNKFKLTATTTSTANDGQAGITFTNIKWYFKKADGGFGDLSTLSETTTGTSGTANNELTVNGGLKPGFYTFMAVGETSGTICSTVPEEFTVFILPPLTVSITSNLGSNTYCSDNLPASPNNALTASVTYDATKAFNLATPYTTNNPTLDKFELRYRWYKVQDGQTLDISTATPLATVTPTTNTTTNTYSIAETAVGSWNYYVVVDYTVKTSGPYQSVLGGGTPTVIQVTAKPGKPTITIEAVN